MKYKFGNLLLLFASLFALSSCSMFEHNTETKLMENVLFYNEWRLELVGSTKVKYADENERITLVITDEPQNVSGHSACNRYFGKVSVKKDKISFKQLASTQMMCPQQKMDLEHKYFQALEKVNAYTIDEEGKLYLKHDDKILLVFNL